MAGNPFPFNFSIRLEKTNGKGGKNSKSAHRPSLVEEFVGRDATRRGSRAAARLWISLIHRPNFPLLSSRTCSSPPGLFPYQTPPLPRVFLLRGRLWRPWLPLWQFASAFSTAALASATSFIQRRLEVFDLLSQLRFFLDGGDDSVHGCSNDGSHIELGEWSPHRHQDYSFY